MTLLGFIWLVAAVAMVVALVFCVAAWCIERYTEWQLRRGRWRRPPR